MRHRGVSTTSTVQARLEVRHEDLGAEPTQRHGQGHHPRGGDGRGRDHPRRRAGSRGGDHGRIRSCARPRRRRAGCRDYQVDRGHGRGRRLTVDRSISFVPIGRIRTPFTSTAGMPIQSVVARDVPGRIELDPAYEPGLADLDGFSHLILVYHLHLATPRLVVTPFLDDVPRGIFATRSPARPNALGISTVRLAGIAGAAIDVLDVDMVDGTPLLVIKLSVPAFDDRPDARIGWFEAVLDRLDGATADDRFGT